MIIKDDDNGLSKGDKKRDIPETGATFWPR
jgi:hypothetical protein